MYGTYELSNRTNGAKKMSSTHEFNHLCFDCGFVANHLTMLKRHGAKSIKPMFDVSTVSEGVCDICERPRAVAPIRDYFYPAERAMRMVRKYVMQGGEK